MKRRTLLRAIPAAALLPKSLLAVGQPGGAKAAEDATGVYELRVYHAAPGKLDELLARFREHTIRIFNRHGMKSVAYWTPLDEPEKSNTLIYILQHPSRELEIVSGRSGVEECQREIRGQRQTGGKS